VAVGGGVHLDDERREEDKHPKTLHSDETTAVLALVGAETVERIAESQNVEAVAYEDSFSIDGDDRGAGAQDGGKRVVAHTYAAPGDGPV
jgi:hypothetical protein